MSYAAWSVVFGEQPSAAKWNILGTNDASFNDGTGIGTNAIAAASIATNAIKIGYAEITSPFTTATTGSYVDVTSLTVTVTVPSGGRDAYITLWTPAVKTTGTAANTLTVALREGSTIIGQTVINEPVSAYNAMCFWQGRVSAPTAGSHTYKASVVQTGGAGTMTVEAGNAASGGIADYSSAYILVMMI